MDNLKRLATHPATVRTCQVVIGLIFGAAGLAKLGDLSAFASQIHNFRMIPLPTENLLAITLPWIEVVIALALLLGIRRRPAALLAAVLMVVFTVAVRRLFRSPVANRSFTKRSNRSSRVSLRAKSMSIFVPMRCYWKRNSHCLSQALI